MGKRFMAFASSWRAIGRHEKGISRKPSRPKNRQSLRVFERLENRELMAVDSLAITSQVYDSQSFLVQFRDVNSGSNLIGSRYAGSTITRQLSSDGWFQVTLDSGSSNLTAAIAAFQSRTDFLSATPDFRITVTATPNDPNYSSLWGLENNGSGGQVDADIDASQAWDYGTSSNVVVAVIDSGVDYNHPDLAANVWTNSREVAGNRLDDDGNGYVDDVRGWNFVSENNDPMDDNGHGTHVAGTIGAVGNNGIGVSGVAWNVKVMALKFLDSSGSGLLSDAVAAIDYARTNGAKIINASWGGGGFSSALQSAIQRFQNAGGIFVAAAGNESSNNAAVASYPANYALSNVISVAASTRSDTLASFSNYGSNVDIAAPGVDILSTVPGNSYARYSGTSMATPHVAGAFALLWGQNPSLSAAQLIDAVMSNTDSVLLGSTIHGRLNVGKAAAALKGSTPSDTSGPSVVQATWNRSGNGLTSVDLTFSEAMRPASMIASNLILLGPNGSIAVTSISAIGNTGTQWRVSFNTQTTAGKYTLTVLPAVTDLAGNNLDQDRDGTAGEAGQDNYTTESTINASRSYSTTGPIALQDATSTRNGITRINIDVADSFTISDLNVELSIDHTYVSDLRIRLIAPDGTSVQLINRRGGSRSNIRVTLDDEATQAISSVSGGLTGTFRPERSLASFDSKNAKGRWVLEVTDLARFDSGNLNSVSLVFAGASGASSASTASGNSNSFTPSTDSAVATAPAIMDLWLALWERIGRRLG